MNSFTLLAIAFLSITGLLLIDFLNFFIILILISEVNYCATTVINRANENTSTEVTPYEPTKDTVLIIVGLVVASIIIVAGIVVGILQYKKVTSMKNEIGNGTESSF